MRDGRDALHVVTPALHGGGRESCDRVWPTFLQKAVIYPFYLYPTRLLFYLFYQSPVLKCQITDARTNFF